MKLIKIVHQLRLAKGTNAKVKVLEEHKDNHLWNRFLIYTLTPTFSYNVSPPKDMTFDEICIDEEMFNDLDKLSSREVTGNNAKKLALELSKKYGEIPRLILEKSLKSGVSFKLVNRVSPGLIYVFESMKGKDCPISKLPVLSSVKYDGVKVFVKVKSNQIFFRSSSGQIFIANNLSKEFENAMYGIYEGELIYDKGRQVDRSTITGILNKLLTGTLSDIPNNCTYNIYDFIPLDEWSKKEGIIEYQERYETLLAQFSIDFKDSALVKLVDQIEHYSIKEIISFYNNLIEHGYEGSMHRYKEDVYQWNRSECLIKKKAIKECVLTCVSCTPHSNPSKGIVGSLVCEGIVHDKEYGNVQVKVNVGSGLSKFDIQRSEDSYIGEQIEILYNTVTKTDGKYSLFLPRYKRIY